MNSFRKFQKDIRCWMDIHKEAGDMVESVCKKLNHMSFISSSKLNSLNAGVTASALLPKAIDSLSDSQDKLVCIMEDLQRVFEKIAACEKKLIGEITCPVDGAVVAQLVEQVRQQTLLDNVVIEQLQSAGYDAVFRGDIITTMMACFLYSPFLTDIDLEQFVNIKIEGS